MCLGSVKVGWPKKTKLAIANLEKNVFNHAQRFVCEGLEFGEAVGARDDLCIWTFTAEQGATGGEGFADIVLFGQHIDAR